MKFSISKPKTILFLTFGSVVLLNVFTVSDSSYNNLFSVNTKTDAYIYPITSSSTPEEWERLETLDDKIDACRVPEDILRNMSTIGLIETCFNYPLFGNVFAYSSLQHGFERVLSSSNAIQELMTRSDSAIKLLEVYLELDHEKYSNFGEYPQLRSYFIELLIAQPGILSSLNKTDREILLDASLKKVQYNISNKLPHSNITSILLISRILLEDNSEFKEIVENNEELKKFIENVGPANVTQKELIEIVNKLKLCSNKK